MSFDTAKLCPVELGAVVETVFALSFALLAIEERKDTCDVSDAEKAITRDRLTYKLFLRSQELKNLVETGSIEGAAPVAAVGGAA